MTRDEQNLDLLAVFHYIVGGVTALFSCFFLIHAAMGIAVLCGAFEGKDAPPRVLGWFFVVFASMAVLTGWTLAGFMIASGRRLKRRASRIFCLVVAGVECAFVPFGTVLGVFTIVVLTRESVISIFSRQADP